MLSASSSDDNRPMLFADAANPSWVSGLRALCMPAAALLLLLLLPTLLVLGFEDVAWVLPDAACSACPGLACA
jgi:hypothetical protein